MKFIAAFLLSLLASAAQAATPTVGLPIIWNSQRMHVGNQEFGEGQQFAGIILQINPQPQILIFSANGNFVISGVANDDTGIAINSWMPNPAVGSGGGGGGSGSLSGMTAGQVPIAATDTTVTSSFPLGTGTQTALGINVGSAGSVLVSGGALGTPSSGVATNLTGTAAGLTAGNVTTNANLTGPVTSAGNATAIANGAITLAKLGGEVDGSCVVGTSGAWAAGACGSTSFANPTATVGPTATNGSATTAMRSDAAPAINLVSTYNWTGAHSFAPSSGIAISTTRVSAQPSIAESTSAFQLNISGTNQLDFGVTAASVWTLPAQISFTKAYSATNPAILAAGLANSGIAFSAGNMYYTYSSHVKEALTNTGLVIGSGLSIGFTSGDADCCANDAGISRTAAGVIAIGNGSGGDTTGSVLSQVFTATKTSNYSVMSGDTNKCFDTSGAGSEVDFTLEAAAAGLQHCFIVYAAQTLKVIAATGEKIAIGSSNSATSGNVTNGTVYGTLHLVARGTGQWVARSHEGTWTVN